MKINHKPLFLFERNNHPTFFSCISINIIHCCSLPLITSLHRSVIIPDNIRIPFGLIKFLKIGLIAISTSATIFAVITSYPLPIFHKEQTSLKCCRNMSSLAIINIIFSAFSFAVLTEFKSISTAAALFAPEVFRQLKEYRFGPYQESYPWLLIFQAVQDKAG